MKQIFSIIGICLCSYLFIQPEEADKVALIVAISDYPKESGWTEINGENDISLIKDALLLRGFLERDIHILQGAAATKSNIVHQLESLKDKIAKDGFFVFHFSGHGQQVIDAYPKKDEVDKFDEALVPYDAFAKLIPGKYKGEHHILDDELGAYILPIRKKLGKDGQLLMLVDACHSGSILRGDEEMLYGSVRGSNIPLMAAGEELPMIETKKDLNGFFEEDKGKKLASTILISATRPGEVNREYFSNNRFYGPLSYTFARVFSKLEEGANYQLLFELLQREMFSITSHQAPTIEGNKSLLVGENKLSPVHDYQSIVQIFDSEYLEINTGKVFQVYEGTELSFYPSDVDTVRERIANGTVVEAGLFKSTVKFTLKAGQSIEKATRAYIKKQDFGDLKVSVALDVKNVTLDKELRALISEIQAIELVPKNAQINIVERGKDIEVLANGVVLKTYSLAETAPQHVSIAIVNNTILKYSQTNFLADLEVENSDYKITGRLIPVTVETDGDGNVIEHSVVPIHERLFSKEQVPQFRLGSSYQIEITNEGKKSAYLCILDIQPDGQFTIAVPFSLPVNGSWKTPEDYFFQPGEKKILEGHFWGVGEPSGIEQYTIIATDQPIDIRQLDMTRGTSTAHNLLESFFKRTYNGETSDNQTRDGRVPPIAPTAMNIDKVFIEIVE